MSLIVYTDVISRKKLSGHNFRVTVVLRLIHAWPKPAALTCGGGLETSFSEGAQNISILNRAIEEF